jgi:hypothetical protein
MKFIKELKQGCFESSCYETDQFRSFYNLAKKEIKSVLKPYVDEVIFSKGHFEFYGFFKTKSGKIFYFSISDVRWFNHDDMLIRTAEHFKDFTGGSNCSIPLDESFPENLVRYAER